MCILEQMSTCLLLHTCTVRVSYIDGNSIYCIDDYRMLFGDCPIVFVVRSKITFCF